MIQGFSGGLLNRELIYQTDLPSFQRDFASLKTLDHGTGPAITFTRASNATYFDADGVLQTASNNVARFDHDPATGASRGLLIEEARTNSIAYSEDFGDASWAKLGGRVVITTNQIVAPDGNLTADFAEANGGDSGSRLTRQTDVASSDGKTLSVFAKAGTASFLQLLFGEDTEPWANFDLSAGTVGSTGTVLSATITPVGNGWFRCQVATSSTTATNGTFGLVSSSAAGRAESNTLSTGLYIWGAQLEAGGFATSYIPTTGATATRAADSAVVTPISSFYNQAEGTLFADGVVRSSRLFSLDDNTTTSSRIQIIPSSSVPQFFVSGAAAINLGSALASGGERLQIAAAYKADDFAASRDGAAVQTDTSGSAPLGITHLRIGRSVSPFWVNGHLRKLAYWPKRLSNALLEQLTT
jgi:hypothetical protein